MGQKSKKKRHWWIVVYPDSAPADWREQLQKTGLLCAISPLHDSDMDPDGSPKKPHWHVMLVYEGPTTYNVVDSLSHSLGSQSGQPIESIRGAYRYLTHEDNPEKAQYNKADIETLNGFDIKDYVEMSKSESLKYKRQIMEFIEDNDITEYYTLMMMISQQEDSNLFDVASGNTFYFSKYIESRKFTLYGKKDDEKKQGRH